MAKSKLLFGTILLIISLSILVFNCDNSSPTNSNFDSALNGTWSDSIDTQSATKQYVIKLKFNNGNFEWTWDGDLQQRGTYDTNNGVLTITITNNYGYPQRLLGDYSRKYSIKGNILTWGGSQYTKY